MAIFPLLENDGSKGVIVHPKKVTVHLDHLAEGGDRTPPLPKKVTVHLTTW